MNIIIVPPPFFFCCCRLHCGVKTLSATLFRDIFYRSLEAPRLSDFLDCRFTAKNDNSKENERFSYTVSSPSLKSAEIKNRSRSKDVWI